MFFPINGDIFYLELKSLEKVCQKKKKRKSLDHSCYCCYYSCNENKIYYREASIEGKRKEVRGREKEAIRLEGGHNLYTPWDLSSWIIPKGIK